MKNLKCIGAKNLYTGKSFLEDVYIIFEGNKIKEISKQKKGEFLSSYHTVTPAFIDAHSHIGMCRAGEPASEDEANDRMESIILLADALDSVQMDDTEFKNSIEAGILYSCVVPGSGNIIGGYSSVIRNYAKTTTDAFIKHSGIKSAFGYNPISTRTWKGTRPYTRMGALAIFKGKLYEVKQKYEKFIKAKGKEKKAITFSKEEQILLDILLGKERLRVHVHKIDDIASLLRVVDEFNIKITVEHAGDVFDSYIFTKLKEKNIPVIYGPLDTFPYKVELKHESLKNIKHLISSGVNFGLMSDHPVLLQSMLFLSLRWFLRTGLSKQQTIEIITRKNAELLGIENILGTVEKNKWASFICFNGDPFELSSYPVCIFAEGDAILKE